MPERKPSRPFEEAMQKDRENHSVREESKKDMNESKAELQREAKEEAPDQNAEFLPHDRMEDVEEDLRQQKK